MERIIHIFDLDDTLLETPTFGSMVGSEHGSVIDTAKYYTNFFESVNKSFLDVLSQEVSFLRMHDFVVPVNSETNQLFSSDLLKQFTEKKHFRMFEERDNVIVLKTFPGFHIDPQTLGSSANQELVEIYNNVTNKMILTGRDVSLEQLITERLKDLGMSHPNFGLYTYKTGKLSIEKFKISTILNSIAEMDWTTVHFYEDRKDWLYNAMDAVNQNCPTVTFMPHLITNVKEKMKLT